MKHTFFKIYYQHILKFLKSYRLKKYIIFYIGGSKSRKSQVS